MKPFQQRRLFFQAATSNINRTGVEKMLSPACGWIAAILAALLFGCASLTPERVNVIAGIAGQAATVGAAEWLAKHPEHKASFDAVLAALIALQKAGNTNEDAAVELLSSLPTDALRGPDGELYVAGDGGLVVWDGVLKKSVAVRGPATAPVIRATVLGLRRATGPKPPPIPKPGTALALPPGVVVKELEGAPPRVITGKDALLQQSRLTEPYPGAWKNVTNVHELRVNALTITNPIVASTFDVTLNEHGVQQVNVRWAGAPGIYTVQRSEDGKAWEGYASITNSGVWTTLWPAPIAVGEWRVLRAR